MSKSFLFLAPGFEEIEAIATVDILRRGGLDIYTVACADTHEVAGAHSIIVRADALLLHLTDDELRQADWLICPGGMPGASNLAATERLTSALRAHAAAQGHIAAICASPAVVLSPLGILAGHTCTCYPGFEPMIDPAANLTTGPVETSANIVTANGPASTIPFALAILAATPGADPATVAAGLLAK